MKRFTVPCKFGSIEAPFHIYIGAPHKACHPLQNQAYWVSSERKGSISKNIMESFEKLKAIAIANDVNFEDLCVYALGSTQETFFDIKDYDPALFQAKVLELSHIKKFVQKPHKRTTKDKYELSGIRPGYAPMPHWPEFKKAGLHGDSMLRKTYPETVTHIQEMAHRLWPGEKELALASRMFFLGLSLYIATSSEKELTLSAIYQQLTGDDPMYALVVILDTLGAIMPSLAFTLITHWLRYKESQRESIIVYMSQTLIDFALSPIDSKDAYKQKRKALSDFLLKGTVK